MRTITRNWKRMLLASVVLALGAWLVVPQTRAEETEKPKAEKKAEKAKPNAKIKAKVGRLVLTPANDYQAQLKKEEEARNADPAWKPTHEQTAVIKIDAGGKQLPLNNFCLNTDGNILACCGGERIEYVQDKQSGEYEPKTIGEPAEIRVLSPDGKLLKTWPVEFKPEAICVADDGTIFVAGGGQMAKLDQEGKVLFGGQVAADGRPAADAPVARRKSDQGRQSRQGSPEEEVGRTQGQPG